MTYNHIWPERRVKKSTQKARPREVNMHQKKSVHQKKSMLRGSLTVEMSYIMPIILFLLMGIILVTFFFHDKNIIAGAAYETAVTASTKARRKEGVKPGEMQELFQNRVQGKCILFSNIEGQIQITDKKVQITAKASRRGMKLCIIKTASITDPEKYIREIRKIGK